MQGFSGFAQSIAQIGQIFPKAIDLGLHGGVQFAVCLPVGFCQFLHRTGNGLGRAAFQLLFQHIDTLLQLLPACLDHFARFFIGRAEQAHGLVGKIAVANVYISAESHHGKGGAVFLVLTDIHGIAVGHTCTMTCHGAKLFIVAPGQHSVNIKSNRCTTPCFLLRSRPVQGCGFAGAAGRNAVHRVQIIHRFQRCGLAIHGIADKQDIIEEFALGLPADQLPVEVIIRVFLIQILHGAAGVGAGDLGGRNRTAVERLEAGRNTAVDLETGNTAAGHDGHVEVAAVTFCLALLFRQRSIKRQLGCTAGVRQFDPGGFAQLHAFGIICIILGIGIGIALVFRQIVFCRVVTNDVHHIGALALFLFILGHGALAELLVVGLGKFIILLNGELGHDRMLWHRDHKGRLFPCIQIVRFASHKIREITIIGCNIVIIDIDQRSSQNDLILPVGFEGGGVSGLLGFHELMDHLGGVAGLQRFLDRPGFDLRGHTDAGGDFLPLAFGDGVAFGIAIGGGAVAGVELSEIGCRLQHGHHVRVGVGKFLAIIPRYNAVSVIVQRHHQTVESVMQCIVKTLGNRHIFRARIPLHAESSFCIVKMDPYLAVGILV